MQFLKGFMALHTALSRRAKGAALSAWEVQESLCKAQMSGGVTSHPACAQGAPWGWPVYCLASLAQGEPLGHMGCCGLGGAGGGHWCCIVSYQPNCLRGARGHVALDGGTKGTSIF